MIGTVIAINVAGWFVLLATMGAGLLRCRRSFRIERTLAETRQAQRLLTHEAA